MPAAVLLHNVEEALTVARYAPRVRALLPEAARALVPPPDRVYVALVVVTLIPIALALLVRRRTANPWATYALLLFAAVVLVNVVWHAAAAVWLRGYAPGVLTAVAINLPVTSMSLRWARLNGWLSRGALWTYIAIGVLLHGAGLLAVVAFMTFTG